jgi:predicted amino acid-binding ACT domain protein
LKEGEVVMQVLGGLIRLNENDWLPVPWWYRAPLGLKSGTEVFAGLTKTAGRPVGDIVVSVLSLPRWNEMLHLQCQRTDEPGVLAALFETVAEPPLNIALAETVTLDAGRVHHATLVCEPHHRQKPRVHKDAIERQLNEGGFKNVRLDPNEPLELQCCEEARIMYGRLKRERSDWQELVQHHHPKAQCEPVHLDKVVVSADTEKRILRYIFPRKGALTVEVRHQDEPGALDALTKAFATANMNVLSALLRRGGTWRNTAELIAVCEPRDEQVQLEGHVDGLEAALKRVPALYRAEHRVLPDTEASDTLYCTHPHSLVAYIPERIIQTVMEYRSVYGQKRVFFSRRFIKGARRDRVVARVFQVVARNGWRIVEAYPGPGEPDPTPVQVQAKMWVSDAAIVLVSKDSVEDHGLSYNIAHEIGFFQGQGKPVLILCQSNCAEELEAKLANYKGWYVAYFPEDDSMFNPDAEDSIDQLIVKWLAIRFPDGRTARA